MIIVDTSALYAFFDATEPDHDRIDATIATTTDSLVVSPVCLAELDYLLLGRHGVAVELTVLRELASGAYELATFDQDDLAQAVDVIERYADQEIGLADASIVVLAKRYRTRQVLTLDHRHFDVLRPLDGGRFTLLPGR